MDENKTWQKLAAEFLGTAFLVFVGVGSVPATLIVNGDAPFTMASLGFISLAFGTIVIATVYIFGYISGNHINPAVTLGLAVTGKFPWRQVPGYLIAQVLGAILGSFAIVGVLGQKAVEVGLGVAVVRRHPGLPGLHRRVRRHVHPGVHGVRRDPPQGVARLRRHRHRPRRVRRDHPGRPGHRRLDQPGPHHGPDARAAAAGRRGALGAVAGLRAGRARGRRRGGAALRADLEDHAPTRPACARP